MYSNILVAIDGSEASKRGLIEAIRFARATGGKIRLIHVLNEVLITVQPYVAVAMGPTMDALREGGKGLLNDAARTVRAAGVEVDMVCEEVIGGHVGAHITEHAKAWQADIIVMGTHGRRGIRRLVMGSDAEFVVSHTPIPVLLVRSQAPSEK